MALFNKSLLTRLLYNKNLTENVMAYGSSAYFKTLIVITYNNWNVQLKLLDEEVN